MDDVGCRDGQPAGARISSGLPTLQGSPAGRTTSRLDHPVFGDRGAAWCHPQGSNSNLGTLAALAALAALARSFSKYVSLRGPGPMMVPWRLFASSCSPKCNAWRAIVVPSVGAVPQERRWWWCSCQCFYNLMVIQPTKRLCPSTCYNSQQLLGRHLAEITHWMCFANGSWTTSIWIGMINID